KCPDNNSSKWNDIKPNKTIDVLVVFKEVSCHEIKWNYKPHSRNKIFETYHGQLTWKYTYKNPNKIK
ncbi:MAG: hypothetical protein ACKVJP_12395, partial [Flavobacteriales bacterium]